eukprot:scaffold11313_cov144-Skeletonema_marinoi.AAC.7
MSHATVSSSSSFCLKNNAPSITDDPGLEDCSSPPPAALSLRDFQQCMQSLKPRINHLDRLDSRFDSGISFQIGVLRRKKIDRRKSTASKNLGTPDHKSKMLAQKQCHCSDSIPSTTALIHELNSYNACKQNWKEYHQMKPDQRIAHKKNYKKRRRSPYKHIS